VLVNTLGVFPAVDAAHRAGIPSIWALHESFKPDIYSYICWGLDSIHPHAYKRFKTTLSLPRALVFEARQTADLFSSYSNAEDRFVVDYGVDVDEIDRYRSKNNRQRQRAQAGYREDDLVIAVVGTVEPRKSQALANAAFEEIAKTRKDVHLVHVGSHPSSYNKAIIEQMERYSSRDRISLIPITPDVFRWYSISDLLLCASDVESLPRSIIEAMAFHLPVVSTDAFGIVDLIEDGRTGWLTRQRDLESLVAVMRRAVSASPGERLELSERARAEAERRHGEGSYGDIFADALNELLVDPQADLGSVFKRSTDGGSAQ
jgi:glycosyltransferase involved in cell wall biosynthesis